MTYIPQCWQKTCAVRQLPGRGGVPISILHHRLHSRILSHKILPGSVGWFVSHIYIFLYILVDLYMSSPQPLFVAGRISSVRRGCWSNVRLYPVNKDALAGGSQGSTLLWDTFPPIQGKYLSHWHSIFSKKAFGIQCMLHSNMSFDDHRYIL